MPSEEAYARLKKRAAVPVAQPGPVVEAEATGENLNVRKRPRGEEESSRSLVRRSKDATRADEAKRGRGLVLKMTSAS